MRWRKPESRVCRHTDLCDPDLDGKAHPDILATTKQGSGIYGARQIMDITHPAYLFYAERIIRKLMEVIVHRKCVIGFQLDNGRSIMTRQDARTGAVCQISA